MAESGWQNVRILPTTLIVALHFKWLNLVIQVNPLINEIVWVNWWPHDPRGNILDLRIWSRTFWVIFILLKKGQASWGNTNLFSPHHLNYLSILPASRLSPYHYQHLTTGYIDSLAHHLKSCRSAPLTSAVLSLDYLHLWPIVSILILHFPITCRTCI